MKVSALILTRNRPKELLKCLKSIREQTVQPDEIIILDNGSEIENSLDKYNNELMGCLVLKSDKNLGCPGGRNLLIEKSNYDLLLFIDDDGILEKNTIKNGLKYFNVIKDLAVVTFRIIDHESNRIRDGFKKDIKPFFHHTFGGGSCIIHKDVIKKTGKYPTDFLRQGEENDLAIRILNAGYKIIYAPDCILFHSEIKSTPDVYINAQLSTILSSWKLLPVHYAFIRTLINYLRLTKYLKKNKLSNFNFYELIEIIIKAYKKREKVKYITYLRWLFLIYNVKLKKYND